MQFRNGKMYIPTDKGSLSVNGVGYLEIESDLIRLNLGITSDSKSAEEAKDKNLQTLESLITSLTDYGIPKEDINTKDISVTRNYIGCDNQQLSFIVTNLIEGYRSNTFNEFQVNIYASGYMLKGAITQEGFNEILQAIENIKNPPELEELPE